MNLPPAAETRPPTPVAASARPPGRIVRILGPLRHLVFGAVLVQSFAGALWVLGWTQRLVRRAVLRHWWSRRPAHLAHVDFEGFCAGDAATAAEVAAPGWILGRLPEPRPGLRGLAARLRVGLLRNLRLGLLAGAGLFLLVGPGELLWATSWYAGWQNSFNKGYEHAYFGPAVFALGMLAFAAGMSVLPMAATRLAVTGRFRTLFEWRRLWRWSARRWFASTTLALAVAGASSAALLVKTVPGFFPQMDESRIRRLETAGKPVPSARVEAASPTRAQALSRLDDYHLLWAFVLFPAFVGVRLLAARVYAGAVLDGLRGGAIGEDDLDESEWQALRRLDLLAPRPVPGTPRWRRAAAWLGTRTGRVVSRGLTLSVWMALGLLVLLSEFLRYTGGDGAPGRGWWNQPMIQVPWMNWTPAQPRDGKAEDDAPGGADSPSTPSPTRSGR